MIFILHYILLNAGLPFPIMLLTLFLQTYSEASLTEIGTLLMVLPFVSIVVKPLFCALADRQQAHKYYLMGSCFFMGLGYGSLAVAPFFPQLIQQHGRLVWWLDVVGVVVGFSAFGVIWSLGDAMALQAARKKGIPWGSYRVWGTLSWGVFGYLMGMVNESPGLPKYVPALIILSGALGLEVILLCVWPSSHEFDMSDNPQATSCLDGVEPPQEQPPPLSSSSVTSSSPPPAPAPPPLSPSPAPPSSDPTNQIQLQQAQPAMAKDAELGQQQHLPLEERFSMDAASYKGTLGRHGGSASVNPRLVGALANVLVEELGESLRASLRGGHRRRPALSELLDQHQPPLGPPVAGHPLASTPSAGSLPPGAGAPPPPNPNPNPNPNPANESVHNTSAGAGSSGTASRAGTFGRATLRRAHAALTSMNSLSAASGLAIDDELRNSFETGTAGAGAGTLRQRASLHAGGGRQPVMYMSSLASNASFGRAAAARALVLGQHSPVKEQTTTGELEPSHHRAAHERAGLAPRASSVSVAADEAGHAKSIEQLQLILLKLIVKRDINVWKYMAVFTLLGMLMIIHLTYFFLHVEQLCRELELEFSRVSGAMLVAQSISEICGFILAARWYIPLVGRTGSIITAAIIYLIRYGYYATYFVHFSPYYALTTETCHGLAYGIIYTLVTEIAADSVDSVDEYLPELIERKFVDPSINPAVLKLPLRATMQGVFSGAFDGLGSGIGALFAGIFLDRYSYTSLWAVCAIISLAIAIVYPLGDLRRSPKKAKKENLHENGSHNSKTVDTVAPTKT